MIINKKRLFRVLIIVVLGLETNVDVVLGSLESVYLLLLCFLVLLLQVLPNHFQHHKDPTNALHVHDKIFAFAFRHIAEAHGHPGHIMCLAIGDDPTPLWERGIVRAGAATIYARYERSGYCSIKGCSK